MVTVRDLHQLHLYVNSLVDNGECPSTDEVEEAALSGEIIEYLDEKFDAFEAIAGPETVLDVDGLNSLFSNHYVTDTREHLLVENNGLVALSGVIFEILSIDEWDTSVAASSGRDLMNIEFSG